MRLQGRLIEWHDDRGFGFVQQHGTNSRAFVHISAVSRGGRRPVEGDIVTYELSRDDRGRPRATNVMLAAAGDSRREAPSKHSALPGIVGSIFVVALLVYGGVQVSRIFASKREHPGSSWSAAAYRAGHSSGAPATMFSCSVPKSHCSQMTSCAEAMFYQETCAVTGMDGDHDGIPCEMQWCN